MYRVEITARARDEADEIHAWMAANLSPAFADQWYKDLLTQIGTLAKLPTRCPVAAESHRFPDEIRELLFGRKKSSRHRIIFKIVDDTVYVLFIRHTARDELEP